jgi:hypothetical protein
MQIRSIAYSRARFALQIAAAGTFTKLQSPATRLSRVQIAKWVCESVAKLFHA